MTAPRASTERTLVLAGGGTGGHLYPALALAAAAQARGDRVVLITGDRPIEDRILATETVERRALKVSGFATAGLAGRIKALLGLLPATVRAWRWLGELAPELVILTGGYVALPVGLAAWVRRMPMALIEPNAIPGRATRLLARFARAVVAADPELPLATGPAPLAGVPVRAAIVATGLKAAEGADGAGSAAPQSPLMLVLGGSQGAASLNRDLPAAVPAGVQLRVLHVAGPGRTGEVAGAYGNGVEAEVVEYIDDMAAAYAQADFAVTRAGAGTVSELMAAGVPALLVPYPHAADDHQRANARILVAAGGGLSVEEGEGFDLRLAAGLRQLLDPATRGRFRAALAAGRPRFDPAALLAAIEAAVGDGGTRGGTSAGRLAA